VSSKINFWIIPHRRRVFGILDLQRFQTKNKSQGGPRSQFDYIAVMQFFLPEFSISQEIGLSEFLHQHSIHGQTILFIHENTWANYHRLLIYHPPPLDWAFKALLSIVCMGHIDMPVCICCVYFHQKLNDQLFKYHASAFECILNLVNPRYQTRVNRIAMNPTEG
jgi:hypothetical protein